MPKKEKKKKIKNYSFKAKNLQIFYFKKQKKNSANLKKML